eukprot:3574173-Pyramimonas_sp.AAC.2
MGCRPSTMCTAGPPSAGSSPIICGRVYPPREASSASEARQSRLAIACARTGRGVKGRGVAISTFLALTPYTITIWTWRNHFYHPRETRGLTVA